ncbi:BREX-1 system adenine-specific DNA-methyltransferase PglX [Latilactobacillus sakei]|uniref:BREX-1 system adenine-specific DNA-methyltransferase PglX n=1 Tax=Latilactobacillus sakei TaxID=1599 RepID=UPI003F538F67
MTSFALQELKLIDPSMGSGHILVYAFDVFMQLYEAEGESPRTASELILENNLFGLDIDQRAFQLAYFALMMKGRQYSRRILAKQLRPNVYVIPNNSEIGETELQLVQIQFNDQKKAQQDLLTLVKGFKNGAELGSLIQFEGLDFENLKSGLNNINISFFDQSIKEMILVGELLQQQYEIGITNPPYMGSSGMDKILSGYVKKIYPDSKSDLFGIFIERLEEMIKPTGYYAMITQHAWMFLSSFEKLRIKINQQTIVNMAHLGTRAFEEIGGEVVQTTSFVITPKKYKNYAGGYLRLVDFDNYRLKETKALDAITGSTDYLYTIKQDRFLEIPGQPISYWVSENILKLFTMPSFVDKVNFKEGITTANNSLFLRYWFEIDALNKNWIPYNKGGSYRKWFGNNDYLVNWYDDGNVIKNYPGSSFRNKSFQRSDGATFSALTSGNFSVRKSVSNAAFDSKGTMFFSEKYNLYNIIGYMNTNLFQKLLSYVSPTLDYRFGTIQKLPLLYINVENIVKQNILLSKKEYTSFETTNDFSQHPLIGEIV